MPIRDTKTIVHWLADGARSTVDTKDVLDELCNRLVRCGIPICRVGLFVLTLDPLVMGQRFMWKPGADVEVNSAPFEAFLSDDFQPGKARHRNRHRPPSPACRQGLPDGFCDRP